MEPPAPGSNSFDGDDDSDVDSESSRRRRDCFVQNCDSAVVAVVEAAGTCSDDVAADWTVGRKILDAVVAMEICVNLCVGKILVVAAAVVADTPETLQDDSDDRSSHLEEQEKTWE